MTHQTFVRKEALAPKRPGSSGRGPKVPVPTPEAVALRLFDRAAKALGIQTADRSTLLNIGRTKLFEVLKEPDPQLDVDQKDRLGYFLAIYEHSGRLVGSPDAWLKAPNTAPVFAGKPPLERMLGGRMEDLIHTLNYLEGVYGGWA